MSGRLGFLVAHFFGNLRLLFAIDLLLHGLLATVAIGLGTAHSRVGLEYCRQVEIRLFLPFRESGTIHFYFRRGLQARPHRLAIQRINGLKVSIAEQRSPLYRAGVSIAQVLLVASRDVLVEQVCVTRVHISLFIL